MRNEKIKDYAAVAAIVAVVVLALPTLQLLTGSSVPLAAVHGVSMLPLLQEGDLVIVIGVSPHNIKVGDIIVYRNPLSGALVIHRVIDKKDLDGIVYFKVKGDNNPAPDAYPLVCIARLGVPIPRWAIVKEDGLALVDYIPSNLVIGKVLEVDGAPVKIPYLGYLSLYVRGG